MKLDEVSAGVIQKVIKSLDVSTHRLSLDMSEPPISLSFRFKRQQYDPGREFHRLQEF